MWVRTTLCSGKFSKSKIGEDFDGAHVGANLSLQVEAFFKYKTTENIDRTQASVNLSSQLF